MHRRDIAQRVIVAGIQSIFLRAAEFEPPRVNSGGGEISRFQISTPEPTLLRKCLARRFWRKRPPDNGLTEFEYGPLALSDFCFRTLAIHHDERPYQSLDNDPLKKPKKRGRPTKKRGKIEEEIVPLSEVKCKERLGGLLKSYSRKAASLGRRSKWPIGALIVRADIRPFAQGHWLFAS